MIIPQYWAEARLREGTRRKPVTVRRFGWSDESLAAAQQHADSRAREAIDRIHAGEPLHRIEPKVPYNGAEGMPIREEIVQRHGEAILSRNSYGALCLNTPDVLFADVDFAHSTPRRLLWTVVTVMLVAAIVVGNLMESAGWGVSSAIAGLALSYSLAGWLHAAWRAIQGGDERIVFRRVDAFIARHPQWSLRIYRTPAGLRVLAMHQRFDPAGEEAQLLFDALGSDPMYVRMCRRQRCFRARVSPKPWRIGLRRHLRPRTAVWPLTAEQRPLRDAWVSEYEAMSRGYAACRFVRELGSGVVDAGAESVRALHDDLGRVHDRLPIA